MGQLGYLRDIRADPRSLERFRMLKIIVASQIQRLA